MDLQLNEHRYRGTFRDPVVIDAAFAQSGPLNIEIIQVKSKGENAFSDMFAKGEGGLHHVAYFCDDYGKERDRLEGLGYPVASEFSIGDDVPVCYVDTRATLSHMVELYPRDRLLIDLYNRVRNARNHWDGKRLFLEW